MSEELIKRLEGKLDWLLEKLDKEDYQKLTLGQISTSIGVIYDRLQKEKSKLAARNPLEEISDEELESKTGRKIVRLKPQDKFKGEYKKKKVIDGSI